MKYRPVFLCMLALCVAGCAVIGGRGVPENAVERLNAFNGDLDESERMWAMAIDDPWTKPELKRRYFRMQDLCRGCSQRPGGFSSVEEKKLCDRVKSPFVVYFNTLRVKVNKLKEQLFYVDLEKHLFKPGSVAFEYEERPSRENLEKLRNIFNRVHRYLEDRYSSWTRYINKYRFQKSRLEHFKGEFANRDREYIALKAKTGVSKHDLKLAGRRADFAFHRLKKEYVTNDLPPAGEVNAFYRADSIDGYHRLLEEERGIAEERQREGRRKEVVVFVHGLAETRGAWGIFPELLSLEDRVNPDIGGIYFKVYVFSFDTVEDSKSVGKFKDELTGFISDIIRDEKVERVHLVGHSFGAVLCLKYIIHELDELLKGVDMGKPDLIAKKLIKAYREGKIHRTVKSFTSIAGSLSGSEIANIVGGQFMSEERLFRRSLPLFQSGVPGYGDIQVRENQIGSEANLISFQRLDTECPLSPEDLVRFLPETSMKVKSATSRPLIADTIPVLCIMGDPVKIQSLIRKEGLLKLGKAWRIIFLEGLGNVAGSFQRDEDDGLVKSYSANINHGYLLESGEDIGYKGASVRYTAFAHFSLCHVSSREHPAYRYVVSFLNGKLLPQMEKDLFSISRFATLLRVFPEGIDPLENPEAHFNLEERIVYLKDKKLVLPPLIVEELSQKEGGAYTCSRNVCLGRPHWNRMTGVRFCEGRVTDTTRSERVSYSVKADGFREKIVTVPVVPGEVSYAVNIVLEKE